MKTNQGSIFRLQSTYSWPPSLEKDVTVNLSFSQYLDSSQPMPEVKVTPAVKGMHVRRSYNGLYLGGPFEASVSVRSLSPRYSMVRNNSGSSTASTSVFACAVVPASARQARLEVTISTDSVAGSTSQISATPARR